MTLSKMLRLLVPATLVFAFATPAWADASYPTVRLSREARVALMAVKANVAAKKASPAVKKPGTPIKKRPALPRR